MTAYLARIDLYPIKSLDGLTVQTAQVLPSGALQHDRALALFDTTGKFINGKRDARIHQVRSRFADDLANVTVWQDDSSPASTFPLQPHPDGLAQWLSDYFQQPVTLRHNGEIGFPDDTDSPGPTLISTATLQTIADWYGLSLVETRRRFRTNLEVAGVPAFWEDQLFAASDEPVPFQVGNITFWGINPCQRCVVLTRDSQTGNVTKGFQKHFIERRAATLPEGVARSRFNHFYRLAVNTRLAPDSAVTSLSVGDAITRL
ncbi:MAG: MOSC N-terminal beta barrel domain-containing protein [Cyanobacteria bacterium P01_D01_bin.115]